MNQLSTTIATGQRARRWFCLPAMLPVLAAILSVSPMAWADTDISSEPLPTLPKDVARPNLLFVMDTSGSMDSAYMPDDMSSSTAYGYHSVQCNGVAYDPNEKYTPPFKYDGTSYPAASLTKTLDDGYNSGGSSTNIFAVGSGWNTYYTYKTSGTQTAMSWTYTAAGLVSNTFSKECKSTVGNTPGSSVFNPVVETAASTDAQNYANWYSYYRKRYLMMRTAMGQAISVLNSSYNVGFSVISDSTATDGTHGFRDVKAFDSTQKQNFYSSLYSALPSGNTPLRPALAKAGQYYANQASGQGYDPVQYSCQRNYTLLSTDGYWNTGLETATYGPLQLDNTTPVGEQDDSEARPMKDAAGDTTTRTDTTYSAPVTADYTSTQMTRTITWSHVVTSSVAGTKSSGTGNSASTCTKTGWSWVTTQTQTAVENQGQVSVAPHTGTSTYTVSVFAQNGVTTSTSTGTTSTTWNTPGTTLTYTYTDQGNTVSNLNPIDPTSSYANSGSPSSSCKTNGSFTNGTSADTAGSPSGWSTATYSDKNINTGSFAVSNGPTVTVLTTLAGSKNTLADVAEYYYKTDLRSDAVNNCTSSSSGSSQNVCTDNVKPISGDPLQTQHMNTFTIGLGVSGTLPWPSSLANLTSGLAEWPVPAETSSGGNATNVDDLWHAALNGRGQYYSALSASSLMAAIQGVVNLVQQVPGAGAAAATSSLELVSGDKNQVFEASYTTGSWSGDLRAFTLDGATATIGTTPIWSARDKLDSMDPTKRTIYYKNGASTTMGVFAYGNLTATQQAYFSNICPTTPATAGVTPKTTLLTQCATFAAANDPTYGTTDITAANSGANLFNWLIGVRTYEAVIKNTTGQPLYRTRDHVLGDIVNGAPVYVAKPPFSYSDAGYADFVSKQTSRKPVVYAAANDGMLHAFSADASDGGTELWAYVPSFVMPNLYRLADTGYASKHQYSVDGAPVMGDIQVGGQWKTILVAGLNDGGKGYYALDITDPANPLPLWEFSDTNLGLSYGNPVITKRKDGTWVVAFSSGYNNADGFGHLFVIDANSGAKWLDISTNVAGGMAKINAWIEDATDNTSLRFYGGDLNGNLWRFDTDKRVLPNQSALLLAQLEYKSVPQPITTRPETVAVQNQAVVIVGTGRYLGSGDVSDQSQQSLYAIVDPLTATGWGDIRSASNSNASLFIQRTLSVDTKAHTATVSDANVNLTNGSADGWYIDLPNSGERIATNMSVQFNTLAVGTAIPNTDACTAGGSSWRYFFNVATGGAVTSNPVGMQWDASSLIVGMSWVKDSTGNVRIIYQDSNGTIHTEVPPVVNNPNDLGAHRTSWRELTN